MKKILEDLLFSYENLFSSPEFGMIFKPYPSQLELIQEFQNLMTSSPTFLNRNDFPGHITGSAFVISKDKKKILLNHHAKLKKWMQLGGHADGNPHIHEVALREAYEESGIEGLTFTSFFEENRPVPFDLDIHTIPANSKEPEHQHYDMRYLLVAGSDNFIISEESIDLKWIGLDDIQTYTQEKSVLRPISKIQKLLALTDLALKN